MYDMELIKEIYIEGLIFNGIVTVIISSIFIKYHFEERKRARQTNTIRNRRKRRGQQLNKCSLIVAGVEQKGARAQQANKYNIIVSELEKKAVKGQQLGKYNLIVADVEPADKDTKENYNITIA